MDGFTVDREIHNAAVSNPETYLTPFPETRYPIFPDPTAEIKPPQPQKLRPIRCQGRTGDDCSDLENSGKVVGGDNFRSELGFLTQLSSQKPSLNNEMRCQSSSPAYISSDGTKKAIQEMKAVMNDQIMELISQGRALDAELSSSSSDDDSESSEAIKEPTNRKRKRKSRKTLEMLMENAVRKVLYNQECMHNKLLEILEQNEKDTLIKEEAWKQQEIERAQRDEELRIEETSRSLALISYIQDLLGHEIQINKPSCEVPCPERDVGEITNQSICDSDPSDAGWRRAEVQSLITVRAALDHKFLNGHKGSLWELVAARLFRMGYNRTAKKCKEKWENINKYYRKTLKSGKRDPACSKSCPFFQELDIIYKSGLITSVNASNNI